MNASALPSRLVTLDIMRTLAIVLMVIFHFIYDLKQFGYTDVGIPNGPGWKQFRQVILTLFFLCVGGGLVFAHQAGKNWLSFAKRQGKVIIAAGLVTAMSLVMFPQNWIFFGVLHFIFIASLVAFYFVPYPRVSLILALLVIAGYNLDWLSGYFPFMVIREYLPRYSNDYVGFFPWIGVVLLGIWLANQAFFTQDPLKRLGRYSYLVKPGQHSLIIYMLHQPILYGILFLVEFTH